jgi:hypothetical protein
VVYQNREEEENPWDSSTAAAIIAIGVWGHQPPSLIKIIFQSQIDIRKKFFNRPGFCARRFSIAIRSISRNTHAGDREKY